jgi:hypothetical protein
LGRGNPCTLVKIEAAAITPPLPHRDSSAERAGVRAA